MLFAAMLLIAQNEQPSSAPASLAAQDAVKAVPVQAVAVSVNPDQAQLSGKIDKPWSVIASLGSTLGTGVFVPGQRNPYFGQSLGLSGSWLFVLPGEFRMRASISQGVGWEITQPDNNTGRRFDWGDTSIGASARLYQIPVVGIDLWGGLRFTLPISLASQRATLITALLPGVGASKSFEWTTNGRRMTFNLRYDFGFRKNFHRFTNPSVVQGGSDDAPYAITRQSDWLANGGLARGFASVEWSFGNSISMSYGPADWVSISISGGIGNTLSYPLVTQVDQYTSPYAVAGPGRRDNVSTSLDFSFTVVPQFLISCGMFTSTAPFNPDNKTLANPFFATSSAANNNTSLYLNFTGVL